MTTSPLVFDGHLDLAMIALLLERDLRLPLEAIRQREQNFTGDWGKATVTLPSMKQGGVSFCVSTILARAKPWIDPARPLRRTNSDWPDPSMAHAIAHGMLAYYRWLEREGEIHIITRADQLTPTDDKLGVIITMEGADPITRVEELHHWYEAGLRTLSLAHFGLSHYAHGTPSSDPANTHDIDGPLTDLGRQLLPEMDKLGMPLDLTHLSDKSFAEAVECFPGRIYASHCACREVTGDLDKQRNLTDQQIRLIVERDGIIGLPLFNAFLAPGYTPQSGPADCPVACFAKHARHICDLAGDTAHVAIGSDLDGGFGREHTPDAIDSIADLPALGGALRDAGFTQEDAAAILGGNWLRFYQQVLPC